MAIDIADTVYEVEIITEGGGIYQIGDATTNLQWEEQEGQLAQRATISAANNESDSLMSVAKINCIVRIYGRWTGVQRQLLFEGTVWEWQYTCSTKSPEIAITAYDYFIRLQQSKDFKYYQAGMNTKDLLTSICSDWGITLDYQWEQSITHEKKVFNGIHISDMIIGLLDEVKQKTGEKYIIYYRDGKLQVVGYGSNELIYKFDNSNTISTSDKLTINNLVTKIKVIGKEENDGRTPVDAVVDGDQSYGVLQEIIRRDANKTVAEAKAEAESVLKERGKPEEFIQVTVPDLPFLRKGDTVEMAAANLIGPFFVLGVSHNAFSKEMTLTLRRME